MPTNRRESVISQTRFSEPDKNTMRRSSVMPANFNASRRRSTVMFNKRMSIKPRPLTEEERKKIARDRFRKAVFKVKAMLRFGLPIRAAATKVKETKPTKVVRYENTYKTEPAENERFRSWEAEKMIKEVVDDNFRTYKYSRVSAPNFSRALSTMIVDQMKEMKFPRYKFVCNVIIGELKGQKFDFNSRCIWEPKTDSSATYSMKNQTCFAVATVHAVYLE